MDTRYLSPAKTCNVSVEMGIAPDKLGRASLPLPYDWAKGLLRAVFTPDDWPRIKIVGRSLPANQQLPQPFADRWSTRRWGCGEAGTEHATIATSVAAYIHILDCSTTRIWPGTRTVAHASTFTFFSSTLITDTETRFILPETTRGVAVVLSGSGCPTNP
jgi:hypothetical protein